jgi:hypothetical protein
MAGRFHWHNSRAGINSLSFENCTFANKGYVYMQEGEYADYSGSTIAPSECLHVYVRIRLVALDECEQQHFRYTSSMAISLLCDGRVPEGRSLSIAFRLLVLLSTHQPSVTFCSRTAVMPRRNGSDYITSGYDGALDSSWILRMAAVPQP